MLHIQRFEENVQVRGLLTISIPLLSPCRLPVTPRIECENMKPSCRKIGKLLFPDLGDHGPPRDENQVPRAGARFDVMDFDVPDLKEHVLPGLFVRRRAHGYQGMKSKQDCTR